MKLERKIGKIAHIVFNSREDMSDKNTWSKESGYIWSMIGSAVGFANILSFSALCYRNGGGAFLIPYLFAHLIIGVPMLLLEGLIGQRTKLPLVSAMGKVVGSKGKYFGWICVITCITICSFYMVLTGFSIAYTYFTARGVIPMDTASFFSESFLEMSGSLSDIGNVAWAVLLPTLLVAGFTSIVLSKNIQSGIERLCTLFLPLLGIMVIAFSLITLFLPGSMIGYRLYLFPDFSRLLDWTLWRDVFGQVFFSLSLGLGIVVAYSRHNPQSFSIPRAMIKVAIGDVIISVLAGFAIFGCIGFMSQKTMVPFEEIVTSDSAFQIGFVIFPLILQHIGPFAKVVGPLFFLCVFIAGITGVFSIVESIAGNIEVEFRTSRKKAVLFTMLLVTSLSIPFCMGNGQYLLAALEPMVMGNALLIGGIAEILIFILVYKVIGNDQTWKETTALKLSHLSLKFIVLPILTLCLLGAMLKDWQGNIDPAFFVRYLWFILILLFSYSLARKKPLLA